MAHIEHTQLITEAPSQIGYALLFPYKESNYTSYHHDKAGRAGKDRDTGCCLDYKHRPGSASRLAASPALVILSMGRRDVLDVGAGCTHGWPGAGAGDRGAGPQVRGVGTIVQDREVVGYLRISRQ